MLKKIKKNKKTGFTITEVITTLVILGIVLAIAIPGVGKLQTKFRKNYYEQLDGSVVAAAKTYFKDNSESRPQGLLVLKRLEYDNLRNKKYIDNINVYNSDDSCSGYVVVVKKGTEYSYYNCMECGDDYLSEIEPNYCAAVDKSIKKGFMTNDGSELTDTIYIYANAYTPEQIKGLLGFKEKYYVDDYANINFETGEAVYPKNITAINLNEETLSTYEGKELKLGKKVQYDDGVYRDVIVFKYPAPEVSNLIDGKISVEGTNKLRLDTFLFKNGTSYASAPVSVDGNVYLDPNNKHLFKAYQYQLNNGEWQNLTCSSSECEIRIDGVSSGKIKFRVVGELGGNKFYGKETSEYEIIKKYSVTYVASEGVTNMPEAQIKIHGVNLTLTTQQPQKKGYTFVGWNTVENSNSPQYTAGATFDIDADTTLYAVWKANIYTVTFDPNKGSVDTATKQVEYDSTYGKLPVPTRTGYTFNGWFPSKTGGYRVLENSKVTITSDQTLYASWGAADYNIEFNANGGTGTTAGVQCYYDNNCSLTENGFTKTGYSFAGWAISANGNVVYSNKATVKNLTSTKGATVTLYAKWSPITYTVAFNANVTGASGTTASKTCTYNSDCVLTSNGFSNGNYIFTGWATTSNGSVAYADGATVKNLTTIAGTTINLYAIWKLPVEGTVTSSCKSVELSEGIYYIEIVGGGAGGLGDGTNYGGNAARWAGYAQLPTGTFNMCAGEGSSGMNGGVGIASIFLGGGISNGDPSYIANSDDTKLITAQGGISYHNKPYTKATVTFGTNVKKSQCNLVGGKQCASTKSAGSTNCAKKSSTTSTVGYGIGGYREYNGGRMGNGYAGTSGLVYYKYIMSSNEWNSNPEVCPSAPYKCSEALCKWVNWPTS